MKVYFWGVGRGCQKALKNCRSDVEILGFIDNNPEQYGRDYCGRKIIRFRDIQTEYDYIVITVIKYDSVIYQLEQDHVDMGKIFCYFDTSEGEDKASLFFDIQGWKIDILERRIEELEKMTAVRFQNIGYELADGMEKRKYKFPVVYTGEVAVYRIVNEKCSMIRFGDGEFEIMAGRERAPFQKCDGSLQERLKEIIQTKNEKILIGIADNYGDIGCYSDEVADGIREYMTDETRAFHWLMLDPDRIYYNAYLFKCYFPYRDKTGTQERVNLVKKIWNKRDIVIVEGSKTRTGQGNDLLDNARSIQRILCPTKNAYSCYQEILNTAKGVSTECLVLCALGPAGKVLAYDLIQCGYQVVDIGQIDMDYEWYRAGKGKKVPVPTKYVSQLSVMEIQDVDDEVYEKQIIARIGE